MQEEELRRYQSATAGHAAMATVSAFLAGICFTSLILIIQKGDSFQFQPGPTWLYISYSIPLKASEVTFIPILLAFVMFMFSTITFGFVGLSTIAGFSKEEESKMIKCIGRVQYTFYTGLISMFSALVLIALSTSFLVAILAIAFLIIGWIAWLKVLSPISASRSARKELATCESL
jgi:hypothetical protein